MEVKLVKDGVKAEVRVEVEVDTQAEVKKVSRLIFELRKYKLNYLFIAVFRKVGTAALHRHFGLMSLIM